VKVLTTEYGSSKEIVMFLRDCENAAGMVLAAGVSAGSDGKKNVPAGTLVYHDRTSGEVTAANDATTNGVLRYDVDVTYGDAPAAVVYAGTVKTEHLPAPPVSAAVEAMPRITFM
jgi:hypothetical protein